jgi:ribonuclease-3
MLSRVSGDLGLAPLIILGESEKSAEARGMHKALEDVFEALVGALYLDGGISAAAEFITRVLLLPYASAQLAIKQVSAKSRLQEVVQASIKVSPTYKIVDQTGPDHSPTFVAVAMVEGRRVGRGTGASKKEAETASATDALINLGYLPAGGVDVS